jgi:hypothetical protein
MFKDHKKEFIITIVAVSLLWLGVYYFGLQDVKTAEQKGRKIEIQTQIAIQDKKRTGLQKAVWEAIDKGLNERKEIEQNHIKDDENITIYVISLTDSSLFKLFESKYGLIDKERDKILHHKDSDSENR